MSPCTVDFLRHRDVPESWTLAAEQVAGVRILPESDAGRTTRPAPIWAFVWRDCRPLLADILMRATESGAKAVAIGNPEWDEHVLILRSGGWVLPEPAAIAELLAWLVRTGRSLDQHELPDTRPLSAPTVLVHGTLRYVVIDGEKVPLQPRELALLTILARGGLACRSTPALSEALLGSSDARRRRVLAQHLHSLRNKLGRFSTYVEFTKSDGYRSWLRLQVVELKLPCVRFER